MLKKIFIIPPIVLILACIIALCCMFVYEDNNISFSKYDTYISGQQDLYENYNIDFDHVFGNSNDIIEIAEISNLVANKISPGAKLYGVSFTLNKHNDSVKYSDIKMSYYLSTKNENNLQGRMDISIFLPNEDIKYSVQTYYPREGHKVEDLIPISIINGDYIDTSEIENKLKESNFDNGSYFINIDYNKDIHISQIG